MLNKIILKGNVGRAPKVTLTQEGKEIATFSLATTQSWKDTTGEWQSATDWHQITVFRESTIGWIKDVLKRGDTVYVEGKLSYSRWTDRHGQQRFTPHVVIAGREGRVEQLRSHYSTSSTTNSPSSNLNLQDQLAASGGEINSEKEEAIATSPSEDSQERNPPNPSIQPTIKKEKQKMNLYPNFLNPTSTLGEAHE